MNTQLATTQVRLANWANIIHARNESGLSINEYCRQNGLSRGAYFYWLRKLRTAALESASSRFVELQELVPETCKDHPDGGVTVEVGDARIHVNDPGARDTFAMILEVLRYAE